MHEFVDSAAFGIETSGTPIKNNVTNRVKARIKLASIDKFPMPTTLLTNEQVGNIVTCVKALREVARIGSDGTRCRRKLCVTTCREIDGKREFVADGNEAARNVSARNGAGVPSVNEKKDGFERDPDGIAFVCHDSKPFVQVSIDAFDEHWIIVVPRQNVIIEFE